MDTFFKFFSIVFRVKYPLRPIHGIVLYAGIYGSTNTGIKKRFRDYVTENFERVAHALECTFHVSEI